MSTGGEQRIGPYVLHEILGEGGMGTVYRAVQTEPVRLEVALKIIKPGMDTREVVARFQSERQALAVMDHTSIARVLDAGQTQEGRPYFVMEMVRGVPIDEYCDTHKLDTPQRLELFGRVCEAVHHAHQKGVIHRRSLEGHLRSKGDPIRATTIRECLMSEYDFGHGKRGPVIEPPPGKTRITIRLDEDVLEWFREQADAAGGASYQTLINQGLREYIAERTEPLEDKIRRMVREEVARYRES